MMSPKNKKPVLTLANDGGMGVYMIFSFDRNAALVGVFHGP